MSAPVYFFGSLSRRSGNYEVRKNHSECAKGTRVGLAAIALLQFSVQGPWVSDADAQESRSTKSPIKRVITVVGENRTFDHIFARYKPKKG